jgi:hypothetical protein
MDTDLLHALRTTGDLHGHCLADARILEKIDGQKALSCEAKHQPLSQLVLDSVKTIFDVSVRFFFTSRRHMLYKCLFAFLINVVLP